MPARGNLTGTRAEEFFHAKPQRKAISHPNSIDAPRPRSLCALASLREIHLAAQSGHGASRVLTCVGWYYGACLCRTELHGEGQLICQCLKTFFPNWFQR